MNRVWLFAITSLPFSGSDSASRGRSIMVKFPLLEERTVLASYPVISKTPYSSHLISSIIRQCYSGNIGKSRGKGANCVWVCCVALLVKVPPGIR
ncbi:hypothetical protein F4780DRAFT_736171 [Xylariomycetidae sp. FL0641]|nr:hypothetical protein F4780DRAFT_736171 [Xylariomycetidae sp. FL0641]